MRGTGRGARRHGADYSKAHNHGSEAGSDRRSHGRLRFLRDGTTLNTA